jgi:hypothetical protein
LQKLVEVLASQRMSLQKLAEVLAKVSGNVSGSVLKIGAS